MIKSLLLLVFVISLNASNSNYVKICVDPDWMPMESINKDGKHIGIVADILNLLEKKTNFRFTLVPTKTWNQSMLFMKQNKCDILPLVAENEERKKWMNFTPSYLNYPQALVVRADEDKKSLEEILRFPIGLIKGYAAIDWFRNKFPNINIVEVDNADDAFAKIRNREIYSFSDILPIVGYKLQEEGILDLKIAHAIDKGIYSFKAGMGVIKGKDELYSQLNIAINNLDEKQLNPIFKKWVQINIDDIGFDYILLYKILGSLLLLTGVVLFWNHQLNLMVEVKTKKIEDSARELEVLNKKLEEFNNTLESQVKEKTKEIKYLLDNTGQGFLTLNKDFLINKEYSRECEVILGKEIVNRDISNVLFYNAQEASKFRKNLETVLGIKNKNTQFSAITLLPEELSVRGKILKIEYRVIDGAFLLVITDISEKKKLEAEIKKEQNTLKMIVSIIKDNDVFFDIKNDFKSFTDNINECIDESKSSLHNISEIYRVIHTFKASFSQLFMNNAVLNLHNLESKISNELHSDDSISNRKLLNLLQKEKIETFTDTDLEKIEKILGDGFLNKNKFVLVKKQFLEKIEDKCISLADKHKEYGMENILKSILVLSKKSVKSYLDPYVELSLQMSRNMKKPIYDFEILGNADIFLPEVFKKFMYSLTHVFRNAITHGIEDFDTRNNLGKDELGTISCSFVERDNALEIIISDDGAGINVEKIKDKVGNQNLTEDEVYLCIFKDNFSTNDKVNALSGRGVGLSAVKSELDLLNGDIKINSELNIGTRFIFIIPI